MITVAPAAGDATPDRGPLAETATLSIDTDLYTVEAIFHACYKFTDRCFLFLGRADTRTVVVEFRRRQPGVDLSELTGAFSNELIDQRLRSHLAHETLAIRELIYTQAFVEADLMEADHASST